MSKGKSTKRLMEHIKTKHNVEITNSDKKDLISMWYYHGYKRYRYIKNTDNIQNFDNFSQIKAIYEFDSGLKNLIYPMITKLETNLKNIVIDILVTNSNPDIEIIYKNKCIGYLDYDKNNDTKRYKQRLKERLDLRSDIDKTIAYNYNKNDALSHYVHHSRPVPLWVYFELISFGQFGHFFNTLSRDYRLKISNKTNLNDLAVNTDGRLLGDIVFALVDLRNATMHNAVVFDANYNKSGVSKKIKEYFKKEASLEDFELDKIIDYIFVLLILLKKLESSEDELINYLDEFNTLKESLYYQIPKETYGKLLGVDSNKRLEKMKEYLKKQ